MKIEIDPRRKRPRGPSSLLLKDSRLFPKLGRYGVGQVSLEGVHESKETLSILLISSLTSLL